MEEHECTSWDQQTLRGASSGRLCVGTGGKDMGTGMFYCGRTNTLHSNRGLIETHGTTQPRKHHIKQAESTSCSRDIKCPPKPTRNDATTVFVGWTQGAGDNTAKVVASFFGC